MKSRASIMASATPAASVQGKSTSILTAQRVRGLVLSSSVHESGRRGDRSQKPQLLKTLPQRVFLAGAVEDNGGMVQRADRNSKALFASSGAPPSTPQHPLPAATPCGCHTFGRPLRPRGDPRAAHARAASGARGWQRRSRLRVTPLIGTEAQYPRYAPTATFTQASGRQKGTDPQQALL